jgi:hypothetical protein
MVPVVKTVKKRATFQKLMWTPESIFRKSDLNPATNTNADLCRSGSYEIPVRYGTHKTTVCIGS